MNTLRYLLDFFGVENVWDITWAHSVNNQRKLNRFAGSDDIMVIEGDISMSNEEEIIMAHSSDTSSDLKHEDWLRRITDSKKGAKLDFKHPEVVVPCLKVLQELKPQAPILLNADILKGPGGMVPVFSPHTFINECLDHYPSAILSLGWTTTEYVSEGGYTEAMLTEMADVVFSLETKQMVTLAVRACYFKSIPQTYLDMFQQHPNVFITLWNAKGDPPLQYNLKEWVEKNIGLDKVSCQLIDKKGDPILDLI